MGEEEAWAGLLSYWDNQEFKEQSAQNNINQSRGWSNAFIWP